MSSSPRCIAFYLPQYHPIPENDEWWGKGFTEWTNAAKAKPRFPGHYQPHVPADLGFYDLRVPETRLAQADLARAYGIEGFCYYHYWFAGRQIIERPFAEVLRSGQPDFPFCLCWANESWTGIWHGAPRRMLIEQTYPGEDDHVRHFESLLPAFQDRRYITCDGRPVFLIYKPKDIPNCKAVLSLWSDLAKKAGLAGIYFIAVSAEESFDHRALGYDGVLLQRVSPRRSWHKPSYARHVFLLAAAKLFGWPTIYAYRSSLQDFLPARLPSIDSIPCVIPNWDNTARSGKNGLVLHGSTPEYFRQHFRQALALTAEVPREKRLIFVKSWNEWAEGNHLEPDLRYGHGYLQVIKDELDRLGQGARPDSTSAQDFVCA